MNKTIKISESKLSNIIREYLEDLNYPKIEDAFERYMRRISKGQIISAGLLHKTHPMMGKMVIVPVKLNWDEIDLDVLDGVEEYLERRYVPFVKDFLKLGDERVLFEVI